MRQPHVLPHWDGSCRSNLLSQQSQNTDVGPASLSTDSGTSGDRQDVHKSTKSSVSAITQWENSGSDPRVCRSQCRRLYIPIWAQFLQITQLCGLCCSGEKTQSNANLLWHFPSNAALTEQISRVTRWKGQHITTKTLMTVKTQSCTMTTNWVRCYQLSRKWARKSY